MSLPISDATIKDALFLTAVELIKERKMVSMETIVNNSLGSIAYNYFGAIPATKIFDYLMPTQKDIGRLVSKAVFLPLMVGLSDNLIYKKPLDYTDRFFMSLMAVGAEELYDRVMTRH